LLTPNTRADNAVIHSEAGVLSTLIELAASDDPKKNAFQLADPGLHRGGVERVGPAGRSQPRLCASGESRLPVIVQCGAPRERRQSHGAPQLQRHLERGDGR
jgi:hypothetical protein